MDKKKLVHQLDTPYSTAKWPIIDPSDQDTILELLCTLLAPIGQHRAQHVPKSKGKRNKKRKLVSLADEKEPNVQPPPPPQILEHVEVGLGAISRRLQEMTSSAKSAHADSTKIPQNEPGGKPRSPWAAVFVARSGQPAILNNHLPQMVAVASQNCPEQEPIRLVGISKACEDCLSEALGIARVSCIALRSDTPNGTPLLAFVRANVPPIKLEWLETADSGQFQATKINSVPTAIGVKKQLVKT